MALAISTELLITDSQITQPVRIDIDVELLEDGFRLLTIAFDR